jgi:hypothetical protein
MIMELVLLPFSIALGVGIYVAAEEVAGTFKAVILATAVTGVAMISGMDRF